MAIATHQTMFHRSSSIIWIHTDGESNKLGFLQSSQNKQELKVAIKLCKAYIEHGITPTDIVILAGYIVQVGLTKRALARTSELRDIDASTINTYQGEEKPVVILCIVGS